MHDCLQHCVTCEDLDGDGGTTVVFASYDDIVTSETANSRWNTMILLLISKGIFVTILMAGKIFLLFYLPHGTRTVAFVMD